MKNYHVTKSAATYDIIEADEGYLFAKGTETYRRGMLLHGQPMPEVVTEEEAAARKRQRLIEEKYAELVAAKLRARYSDDEREAILSNFAWAQNMPATMADDAASDSQTDKAAEYVDEFWEYQEFRRAVKAEAMAEAIAAVDNPEPEEESPEEGVES